MKKCFLFVVCHSKDVYVLLYAAREVTGAAYCVLAVCVLPESIKCTEETGGRRGTCSGDMSMYIPPPLQT